MLPGIDADDIPLWLEAIKRVRGNRLNDFTYEQGLFFDKVLDRVAVRLSAPPPETRWDRVNRMAQDILDNDPEHQGMLKRFERDRVLRERAFSHMDALMHLRWSLYPDDLRKLFKEPRDGILNSSAWDAWVDNNHSERLQYAYDELERNYDLLNSTHERFMQELKKPRPKRSMSIRGVGGPPVEPPPEAPP